MLQEQLSYCKSEHQHDASLENIVAKSIVPDDLSGCEQVLGHSEKLALRSKDWTAVGVILCFTADDFLEAGIAKLLCSAADGLTMRMRAPGGSFLAALPWQKGKHS